MGDYSVKVNQLDTNSDPNLRYMNNTVFKNDMTQGTATNILSEDIQNVTSVDSKLSDDNREPLPLSNDLISINDANNRVESGGDPRTDDADSSNLITSLNNLALGSDSQQNISGLNSYAANPNQGNFWSNDDVYSKPMPDQQPDHNGGMMQSYSPLQYAQPGMNQHRPMGHLAQSSNHFMSPQRNQFMTNNPPMQAKQQNYASWNNPSIPNAQTGWPSGPMNPWANMPPPPPPPSHQQMANNAQNNQRHRAMSNDKKHFPQTNNMYANQSMSKYQPRPQRSQPFPPSMMNNVLSQGQKSAIDYNQYDDAQRDLKPQDAMNQPGVYDQIRHFSEDLNMPGKKFDISKVNKNYATPLDDPNSGYMMNPGSGSSQALVPGASERVERYSRKVFVGGLPPDIDEEEITAAFMRFGHLVVDWPHKAESKSYFPPKGYCFLLFQDEISVQSLIEACYIDDDKFYWYVSSPTMKDKPVQIRPWNLSDCDFVMDGSQALDPRKTIFVGGVPRPLRAIELAMIMDRLYGGICYAGIDTDPELKYPKGAGRVAFSHQQSYIAAISARFVQLQHADIDKRVEVKPYVLDDQMCDECQGVRCAGKFAPFFCANVTCLQYYCEQCWSQIHSSPGREFHKPLVKEGADRPRTTPFRWC